MAVNLEKEITGLRLAYGRMRGAGPTTGKRRPNGHHWMVPGKRVPQTTWGDVYIAYHHINKYLDPTEDQCIAMVMQQRGTDVFRARTLCTFPGSPRSFVRTSGFKQAKREFESVGPIAKGGFFATVKDMREIYPHNEEFWGAALNYAIERRAAGEVPFWNEIALDSVKEAVVELPSTVRKAIAVIDPRQLVPDISGITNLIKWGSIGGGIFILYWYVLRKPKKP